MYLSSCRRYGDTKRDKPQSIFLQEILTSGEEYVEDEVTEIDEEFELADTSAEKAIQNKGTAG